MKSKTSLLLTFSLLLLGGASSIHAQANDYPLLSQGQLEPPPPPQGYALPVPSVAPGTHAVPVLPPRDSNIPPSAHFNQTFNISKPSSVPSKQGISLALANKIKSFGRSIYTFRSIIDTPKSGKKLRRIQNLSRICSELLGLAQFPVPAQFTVSSRDRTIRDRSYGTVEYRHYGDFSNRLNGWVKPVNTAVYADLVFDGKGRRKTHVKVQMSRIGVLTGKFYAYSWDKYGRAWQLQGNMKNILCRDNGLPSSGDLEICGVDPTGKAMKISLQFPIKIVDTDKYHTLNKDPYEGRGDSVHIGN